MFDMWDGSKEGKNQEIIHTLDVTNLFEENKRKLMESQEF